MANEIVQTEDPLEEKIRASLERAARKEAKAEELSLRLQDAKNSLRGFLGEYQSRVGIHYIALDKINLQIKEYHFRFEQFKNGPLSGSPDALQKIEEKVTEKFAEERRKIQEAEKETQRTADDYKKELRKNEWQKTASPEFIEKVKTLFRKLARKYHPDKEKDPNEYEKCNRIMAAISEAYACGDLDLLILYMEKAEKEEEFERETPEQKLARLDEKYRMLCNLVAKLRAELKRLMESKAFQLKLQVEEARMVGSDLLLVLTQKVLAEIKEKKQELADLIARYQTLAGEVARG